MRSPKRALIVPLVLLVLAAGGLMTVKFSADRSNDSSNNVSDQTSLSDDAAPDQPSLPDEGASDQTSPSLDKASDQTSPSLDNASDQKSLSRDDASSQTSLSLEDVSDQPSLSNEGKFDQPSQSLKEYLESADESWFLTGKKKYTIQAMMVSGELSFHNDLEVADYTVTDDGETVVLKGTQGEMWTAPLTKVAKTYTKPDGSAISEADFAERDIYIDIVTIPALDTNCAMHVPSDISVTVETAWGDQLHTNLPNAPHDEGDYLVCNAGEDGKPDLSDVWVVNGLIFADCYDTSHASEPAE